MDRRRPSPPPPPRRDGRDRPPPRGDYGGRDYGGRDMDRRRGRSQSPAHSDRYGGRGGGYKRHRREDQYYDRFNRDRSPPGYRGGGGRSPRGGYQDDYYDGPRGRGPRVEEKVGPYSFKEFLLQQPDDMSPEEAQMAYRSYLVAYHGNEIKAEFEDKKNDEKVRSMFDPRSFEKALAKRNEEAQESAVQFAESALDYKAPAFNQGMFELAPKPDTAMETDEKKEGHEEGPEKPIFAPAVLWKADRVAHDLVLSRKVIRKLDQEKGIQSNALLPEMAVEAEAGAEDGGATSKSFADVDEAQVSVDDANYDESVGKLDVQLTYLWKVHGVDYYAGHELPHPHFQQRLTSCRLLRCGKPEDGEQPEGDVEKKMVEAVQQTVDDVWNKRMQEGDPLEAKCLRKTVDELIDKWIDSQIVMHGNDKWGSTLSNKLFVGRKFVVKHVKTKHEDKVSAEKDRMYDELYFENFKAFKEEEARQAEAAQQHHPEHGGPGAEEIFVEGGGEGPEGEGGEGGEGFEGEVHMGFEGGMGFRGRGRGMRGRGMMGRGRGRLTFGMDMPIMPMGMPMAGPMGPMFIPAPAGGPMGPIIPLMPGMPMGGIPMMGPGMMMGRGGRGGRFGMMGRGRGGRGFMMAGPGAKLDPDGIREYYDLDNPQNNRAVLDYGDL